MRLQILNLPAPAGEHPFVRIIDEAEPGLLRDASVIEELKAGVGARAVLCFEQRVEVV